MLHVHCCTYNTSLTIHRLQYFTRKTSLTLLTLQYSAYCNSFTVTHLQDFYTQYITCSTLRTVPHLQCFTYRTSLTSLHLKYSTYCTSLTYFTVHFIVFHSLFVHSIPTQPTTVSEPTGVHLQCFPYSDSVIHVLHLHTYL